MHASTKETIIYILKIIENADMYTEHYARSIAGACGGDHIEMDI